MSNNLFLSYSVSCLVALALFPSCRGGGSAAISQVGGDTVPMDYAKRITIVDYPQYTFASIQNPWDTTKVLHNYVLVPDSIDLPDSLPEGTVIRTPLKRTIVHSSVHCKLIGDLGAYEAIKGVCDSEYIHLPEIVSGLEDGSVVDCGVNTSPDIEKVVSLSPDAILLSPYQDGGTYGKLTTLPIAIVECADYMEISPLARAEWIKFYGRLYGKTETADSLFDAVELKYNSLKSKTADVKVRPGVLFDRLYGRQWYVPAAMSTISTLIRDAGGSNPFESITGSGSAPLSAEQVLVQAGEVPYWLVRYSSPETMTLKELSADNKVYSKFDAFKTGNVYGCNTGVVRYYENAPFHPERILYDIISIIHPELVDSVPTQTFFTRLK